MFSRRARSILAFSLSCLVCQQVGAQRPPEDPEAGRAAYAQHCARCHGDTGAGDGVDAKRFYPRPRDLKLGVYKFRSTMSGTPPTDEDLFRTLTDGLPGSNMPDWRQLDEATRWHLVDYLKRLAPIFQDVRPEPVSLGTDSGAQADLAAGRTVYDKLGCAACHGAQGRAYGPSAATLVDDWGMPIRPRNLAQGWDYRGGAEPRAIMTRALAGIDGAGMPSYAEAATPEELWQLSHYVASLQEPPHWYPIVHATALEGVLPKAPDDPRWAQVERADLRLRNVVDPDGIWTTPPSVTMVSLETVYNEEAVALRLTWDDPTEDRGEPGDGLAVLWQPGVAVGDVVSLQAWPHAGALPLDVCRWSAASGETREMVGTSFDLGPDAQPLASRAAYADGRWQLVLVRPRHPDQPSGGAVWTGEASVPLAVAVWDGGNPKARAVSPWIDVAPARRSLEPGRAPARRSLEPGRAPAHE
jgi:cytochrome c oxidase cbb3-type subunit 2